MTAALFVYGTLRKNVSGSRFFLMERYVTFVGYGRIRGRLCHLGRYPGAILTETQDRWVLGEIYQLSDSEEALRILDEYEGCGPVDVQPWEFKRQRAQAVLDSGEQLPVWVYTYEGPFAGKRELISGNYRNAS